jgi:uncharacterized protein YjbI with pentapeptide repeats
MANPEHLARLKQGAAEAWKHWNKANPSIHPDLSGALLFNADLRWADLSEADLSAAILRDASLSGASLFMAELIQTHLCEASLIEADLSDANFQRALFIKSDLRGALSFAKSLPWQ